MITVKTLLSAFINEVVEDISKPEHVDQYACAFNEPKTFEPRVSCKIGGAYWAIRHVARDLSYDQSRELETRMQEFFHSHCRQIMDAYEGLDTPEFQD